MNIQELTISLEEGGIAPEYSTEGAAGLDFFACLPDKGHLEIPHGSKRTIPLGVRAVVPEGWGLLLLSRSGHAFKDISLSLTNCVGLIDSDYRGVVAASLEHKLSSTVKGVRTSFWHPPFIVRHGDKICQGFLIEIPKVAIKVVSKDELLAMTTARGEDGFGSTGS